MSRFPRSAWQTYHKLILLLRRLLNTYFTVSNPVLFFTSLFQCDPAAGTCFVKALELLTLSGLYGAAFATLWTMYLFRADRRL